MGKRPAAKKTAAKGSDKKPKVFVAFKPIGEDAPLLDKMDDGEKQNQRPRTEVSKWNKMLFDNFYAFGFSEEEVRFAQSPFTGEYLLEVLKIGGLQDVSQQLQSMKVTKLITLMTANNVRPRSPLRTLST